MRTGAGLCSTNADAASGATTVNNHAGTGPGGYMITGGSDALLRFWDLGKPEKSMVVGVAPHVKPVASGPASVVGVNGAMVAIDPRSDFCTLSAARPTTRIVHTMWFDHSDRTHDAARATAARLKSPLLPGHTAIYAHMSRAHRDAVTDILLIESPFRCIVAGDRSGCIRVWE